MNYIRLINSFWTRVIDYPLKPSSSTLYLALADMNNRLAWMKSFTPDYLKLLQVVNITKNTYYECLKELVNQGYIEYEISGNRALTGKIKILFVSQFLVHDQDTSCDSTEDTSCDSTSTLNKPINNKTIKPIKQRFVPPTLFDVENFFIEKGSSIEKAKKAFEYYDIAKWHDKDDKPVKNWKQKMIGVWLKDEKNENGKIIPLVSKAQTLLTQRERLKAQLENNYEQQRINE